MIKIEKAIKTADSLRGIVYLKNDKTGKYDEEIGEVDIFNYEGIDYDVYVYLTDKHRDDVKAEGEKVVDKLSLEEKIRKFIWDNYYEPAELRLSMSISFLSDLPTISYES
jgi:hypothetical protein